MQTDVRHVDVRRLPLEFRGQRVRAAGRHGFPQLVQDREPRLGPAALPAQGHPGPQPARRTSTSAVRRPDGNDTPKRPRTAQTTCPSACRWTTASRRGRREENRSDDARDNDRSLPRGAICRWSRRRSLVLAVRGRQRLCRRSSRPTAGQNPWLAPSQRDGRHRRRTVSRRTVQLFNPAFLIGAQAGRLDVGAAVDQADEDRFQPLFDSFDSCVTDTAIASNRHDHFPAGFGVTRPLLGQATARSRSGSSLADRNEFGYVFSEEIREPQSEQRPRDAVLQNRTYKVTGTLRDLGVGAAAAVTPDVSLGAALHYAYGRATRTSSDRVRPATRPELREHRKRMGPLRRQRDLRLPGPCQRTHLNVASPRPAAQGGRRLAQRSYEASAGTAFRHHRGRWPPRQASAILAQ